MVETTLEPFTCPLSSTDFVGKKSLASGSYNGVASLIFTQGETGIHRLFSRKTSAMLGAGELAVVLVVYFFLACWAAGTFVSSGLVVPMLFIGGLYGRIFGESLMR